MELYYLSFLISLSSQGLARVLDETVIPFPASVNYITARVLGFWMDG